MQMAFWDDRQRDVPPHRPLRFEALANEALRKGLISTGRYAEFLGITRREAMRQVEQEAPTMPKLKLLEFLMLAERIPVAELRRSPSFSAIPTAWGFAEAQPPATPRCEVVLSLPQTTAGRSRPGSRDYSGRSARSPPCAAHGAVFPHGLDEIAAARRLKTAMPTQDRAERNTGRLATDADQNPRRHAERIARRIAGAASCVA